MGQRVIPVAVTAEYIGGDGVTLGAAGSHNSVVIEYDFRSAGPMWDDLSGRYVLWTNPQGNNTNRINLGVSEMVEGYDGVYQAAPPADAMCVPGWAEMVVVGFTLNGETEIVKVKTEPSRFRVLPGSSRAADNEGVAPTVADQLQAAIEGVYTRLDGKKVNKPVTPYDENGTAGQVLMSLGDGKTKWDDPTQPTIEMVEKVLERHPDWVTTVEKGSISKVFLDDQLRREQTTNLFLDNLTFPATNFMSLWYAGESSQQGMCIIDNRYLCVCRYGESETRIFHFYDIETRTEIGTSSISAATVGHVNSLAYDNGYIYVSTLFDNSNYIVRLALDRTNWALSYDNVAYSGDIRLGSIAARNGVFYIVATEQNDGKVSVYTTEDNFATLSFLFSTDFSDGESYRTTQGIDFDGEYLYIAVSGKLAGYEKEKAVQDSDRMFNAVMLNKLRERIYVLGLDGTVYKSFDYPRGTYMEIEEVAVATFSGQKYIFVSTNSDNFSMTGQVLVSPLYKSALPNVPFVTPDADGTIVDRLPYIIYVDSTNGSVFGTGVKSNPFKNFGAAMLMIRRLNSPVLIYASGEFDNINLSDIDTSITIFFVDGAVCLGDFEITRCNTLYLSGALTIKKTLKISQSNVIGNGTFDFASDTTIITAVNLLRSMAILSVNNVLGYVHVINAQNSYGIISTIQSGTIDISGLPITCACSSLVYDDAFYTSTRYGVPAVPTEAGTYTLTCVVTADRTETKWVAT